MYRSGKDTVKNILLFNILCLDLFVFIPQLVDWKLVDCSQKEKQRQAARSSNVVIVVASHYQSLQIIVFLSQAGLLEIYLFCKIWLEESWKLFSAEADFLWNSSFPSLFV